MRKRYLTINLVMFSDKQRER